MPLDITKGMQVVEEPETMISGVKTSTLFQLDVPRATYRQLMPFNDTVGSWLEGTLRGITEDKKLFAVVNEDNHVELRTANGGQIKDAGYDKTALTIFLNSYIQEHKGQSLIAFIENASKQAFTESADAIKKSLEVFHAAVRDKDIMYGAYVKEPAVFDMLVSRIPPSYQNEVRPEDTTLIFVTDKEGNLNPRDGASLFIETTKEAAKYKTYDSEGEKYQTTVLVPLSKTEAELLGQELSMKLERFVSNVELINSLKRHQMPAMEKKINEDSRKELANHEHQRA